MMRTPEPGAVLQLLREPGKARAHGPAFWRALLGEGRRADMLGRVHAVLDQAGALAHVPARVALHLAGAAVQAQRRAGALIHELDHLQATLAPHDLPAIVLKGGAYLALDLEAARGRSCNDLDVLVPRARLAEAEAVFKAAGWIESEQPYDSRYYRRWMHELPPLRHVRRGSTLDVHHSLLPRMGARATAALWREAQALPRWPGLYALAPADLLLHSAAHLFHEGEFDYALRGIADIDSLLRHYGGDEEFWRSLRRRAEELGLQRPLRLALRHVPPLMHTPLPRAGLVPVLETPKGLVDVFYSLVLAQPQRRSAAAAAARFVLYIRAHMLRMAPIPLSAHLLRKALRRGFSNAPGGRL